MFPLLQNQIVDVKPLGLSWKSLYKVAGVAALVAMSANLLDVVLGFGDPEVIAFGSKTAVDGFAVYGESCFKGRYMLGILNIVYMVCLFPVYFALFVAHRRKNVLYAALAMILFFIGMAVYISNNAAIPMSVLADKYAAAGRDAERELLAAAGESVLARGEDFTPGSFIGTIFSAVAALLISVVMLRGGVFGKATAWIGIVGFTCLSIFTFMATFVSSWYHLAFYGFGRIGGLLALACFLLVSRRLFQLARLTNSGLGKQAQRKERAQQSQYEPRRSGAD